VDKISIKKSRTGELTAAIGSLRIHSSYNPDEEARRFLDMHTLRIKQNTTILIIGAGLGYMDRILRSSMPDNKIISIHLDSELYNSRVTSSKNSVYRWHPGIGIDIEIFLIKTLHECDVKELKIISWQPSIKARFKLANQILEVLRVLIRRYAGNIDTTATFGRLWIKNMLRNFMDLSNFVLPVKLKQMVVLAASGPSLEYALKDFHAQRNYFQLWALPSALPALLEVNLKPDLIIACDAGYWASQHQRFYSKNIPMAMPLSSSAPPPETRVLLLNQGTELESKLIESGKLPSISVPSMGTVAATAVEVWKRLSEGPLIIAGLDLCWFDLRSHSRPHSFDGWIVSGSYRLRPTNDIYWKRAESLSPVRLGRFRSGSSLETYADWFSSKLPKHRVFRFAPKNFALIPVKLPGIEEVGSEILSRYVRNKDDKFKCAINPESKNQRRFLILHTIDRWRKLVNQESINNETRELMYTLDVRGFIDLRNSPKSERGEKEAKHRSKVKLILDSLKKAYI